MYKTARNPKQMTFHEVFSEFGKGTLSSSSPASRRTGYMAFSSHHKPSIRPTSARLERPVSRRTGFEQLNCVLLKSHFTAIISALTEDGLMSMESKQRLLNGMRKIDWEETVLSGWMQAYAEYTCTRDLGVLVRAFQHW